MNTRKPILLGAASCVALGAVIAWIALGPAKAKSAVPEVVSRDLDVIKTDTLRVLVVRDPLTWQLRGGRSLGFEHDFVLRLAKRLALPVRFVPVQNRQEGSDALRNGTGDLLAAQTGPQGWPLGLVAFSEPYGYSAPVAVRQRSEPWYSQTGGHGQSASRHREHALPDTLFYSDLSPFSLAQLQPIVAAGGSVVVDSARSAYALLLDLVAGRIRGAVVPEALAAHLAPHFPLLAFGPRSGASAPLCFAVRANSPLLLQAVDEWLTEPEEKYARQMLMAAYQLDRPREDHPDVFGHPWHGEGDHISYHDDTFREWADSLGWDWRLVAAMAYKESRFDTNAASHMGAQGIMQLMPKTAKSLGTHADSSASDQVGAAVSYLEKLDAIWQGRIREQEQRLRFVLASYNAGPGHILDAQDLAATLGLDPQRWENHVERAALLLSMPEYFELDNMRCGYMDGRQTFLYVREIMYAWKHYCTLRPSEGLPTADTLTQQQTTNSVADVVR
jgi:membrane-bound lytic murein transglycosylase F